MSEVEMGRRAVLKGAGLATFGFASAAALAACGSGSSGAAARSAGSRGGGSKTVVVRDSGGAYGDLNRTALYEPFTKKTGISVTTVNPEYAQMLAQINTGRPQFDLIDDSLVDFLRFRKADAIAKLDTASLPNLKDAGIAKELVSPYYVGKNYWASVMCYRTDVFGKNPPTSWAEFWDYHTFEGKRSLQDDTADVPELEFALLADGVPMDQLYPLDIDRAFKSMDKIRGAVLKFWDAGALPGTLLGRNEVSASSIWNGRATPLIAQGAPLALQWNGARRQSNGYAVPKGAKNAENAHKLINFSLQPEVQAALSKGLPYGPVVPAALDHLTAKEAAQLPSTEEHLKNGFDIDVKWWLENNAAVDKRWTAWAIG